jgi:Zn-dependent protease
MVRFVRRELRDIAISVLILAVAVSNFDYVRLAVISLPLALGFILHELSHKFIAIRYGYWAAYRMWIPGLALALVVGLASGGRFLFAAPGAVVIMSSYFTSRESGLIGLAGPTMNLGLAGCFYAASYLPGIIGAIGYYGAFINLWLAFFNLLPVSPLDGSKVWQWNSKIGIGMLILTGSLIFLVS